MPMSVSCCAAAACFILTFSVVMIWTFGSSVLPMYVLVLCMCVVGVSFSGCPGSWFSMSILVSIVSSCKCWFVVLCNGVLSIVVASCNGALSIVVELVLPSQNRLPEFGGAW